MKILLGGTFSVLHKGHKKMIDYGLRFGELYIGITSDNYEFRKNYPVPPFEVRKRNVENYLHLIGGSAFISPLDNKFGSTLSEDFEAMVVSNETLPFSLEINAIRRSRGIKPLILYNVGEVFAEDLMPIKSERIIKGEIDENGKRLKPIKIIIPTKNPEKINGIKEVFSLFFDRLEFIDLEPKTNIEQPFSDEILEMSLNRCKDTTDYDYCVSVEAGALNFFNRYFDVHLATVIDRYNGLSVGISSAVPLNKFIIDSLKENKDLNEVISKSIGIQDIGKKGGAVFYFSKGIKTRKELVKEALLSSIMERLSWQIPIVREHVVSLP